MQGIKISSCKCTFTIPVSWLQIPRVISSSFTVSTQCLYTLQGYEQVALKAIRNYDFLRDYFNVNASEIHSSLYRAQVRFSQAFLPSSRSVIS